MPSLPFQDLAGHAGHFAVRQRLLQDGWERAFLIDEPHAGPYSVFRAVGQCATGIFGAFGAVRALAVLPIWLTPLAALILRQKITGRWEPAYAALGLYLCCGFLLMLGFASFMAGAAVCLLAYAAFLQLAESNQLRRDGLLAALGAVATFFTHGYAFAMLGFLVVLAQTSTTRGRNRWAAAAALGPAMLCGLFSQWAVRHVAGHATVHGASAGLYFQGPVDKLSLLVTPFLMTRLGIDMALGIAFWGLLLFSAVRFRPQAELLITPHDRHRQRAFHAAVALSLLFLALPHNAQWFGFVDARLLPLTYLMYTLSLPPQWWSSARRHAATGTSCLQCTILAVGVLLFQQEFKGFEQIAQHIQPERSLLHLPVFADSRYLVAHPFVHEDKLLLLGKPMLLSDMWLHQGTGLYATDANPVVRLDPNYASSNVKLPIAWKSFAPNDWDYVLLRMRDTVNTPDVPAYWKSAAHSGTWWLFERDRTVIAP